MCVEKYQRYRPKYALRAANFNVCNEGALRQSGYGVKSKEADICNARMNLFYSVDSD
jgi:hypothetical protein